MAANFFARLNTAKPYYYREFMFKADDYRLRLKDLSETLSEAKYALDIDNIGEKLKQLQAERTPLYRDASDAVLDNSTTLNAVVQAAVQLFESDTLL